MTTVKQLEGQIHALEQRLAQLEAQKRNNPGSHESVWVTLKEYVEVRLAEQREFLLAQITGIKDSIAIAAHQQELKFLTVNEWRGALTDLSTTMAAKNDLNNMIDKVRSEMALQIDRIMADKEKTDAEITKLRTYKDESVGKASEKSVMIAYLLSGISIVLTILFWIANRIS